LVFTAVGDKGTTTNSININSRITAQSADLHLLAGDLAYAGTYSTYRTWMDQQSVYAAYAPMMPAWGNHDTELNDPPYSVGQAYFALPTTATADERY
jgi:ABC-type uncharacterized transport system YnjBCD substrate-binding protein